MLNDVSRFLKKKKITFSLTIITSDSTILWKETDDETLKCVGIEQSLVHNLLNRLVIITALQ